MIDKRCQQILDNGKQAGEWKLYPQIRESREVSTPWWGSQEATSWSRMRGIRKWGALVGDEIQICKPVCKKQFHPWVLSFTQAETQVYLWRGWTRGALDSRIPGRALERVLNQESPNGMVRSMFPFVWLQLLLNYWHPLLFLSSGEN